MDPFWKEKHKSIILSSTILNIDNISVAYSKRINILSQVSLSLESNQIVALIGENGAGKSTLLKSICGLTAISEGSIKLFGRDFKEWKSTSLAQKIAYVSSSENVQSIITVERFIGFGRYPYTSWLISQTEDDFDCIEGALKSCKIEYLRNKTMAQLSDGERQKVYLARAIAQNSDLIVLDEPTTHLDVKSSISMFRLIQAQKESGRAVLLSSHQIEKTLRIADKVWVVDCGRVIETTPKDFYENEQLKELIFGA
jgi:iron complex transport system ATP-binding protein